MARPQHVTDAELAILEHLWAHGPATVRRITERLYPGGGNSQTATVQKLCERLLAKDCIRADEGSRPRTYTAAVDRSELIQRQLENVADRFCRGSLAPLLSHLVEGGQLSREQIDELRGQIDRLDPGAKGER